MLCLCLAIILGLKECHAEAWPGLRPQPNGSSHEDKVAEFAKIQPAHRRRRLNFRKFSYAGPFSLPPHEKPCQENKTLRICSAELAEKARTGVRAQVHRGTRSHSVSWQPSGRHPLNRGRYRPEIIGLRSPVQDQEKNRKIASRAFSSASSALQTRRVLLFWQSFSLRRWSIGVVREF